MSSKAQVQKKSSNPFCSRRKKRKNVTKKVFSQDERKRLAESDKGSWFGQEKQCADHLNVPSSNEPESRSASKRKLEESRKAYHGGSNSDSMESDLSDSDLSAESDDSSCEGNDEIDGIFKQPTGNYIVNPNCLQSLLESAATCKDCHSPLQVLEKAGSKQGLGAKWIFRCTNESCSSHEFRPSLPISSKNGKIYEINRASVVGFRAIGKGRSAAEKCLSFLDLSPVYTWDKHTKVIEEKVKDLTEIDFKQAVTELKQLKRSTGEVEECSNEELEEKVVDVGASFDCSWSSRGWSARDGLVAAISEDTGKVLDVVYLTRECSKCKMMEEKRTKGDISKLDFLAWYIKHEPNCYLNHEGSSQSMESAGVMQLYLRSIQKHKIRYIPFIGDGDCSSYNQICIRKPYGPTVYIPKVDCISHVTKRMGSNLRSLVRDYKGKKLSDGKGLSGAGRLTIARMDTMQSFYGLCIRQNKGDAKAMAKATKAILYHYASTEETPQHNFCPVGSDSWCTYQRDVANHTKLHKPIKNPLPPAVITVIKPLFDRLGDEKFLAGCEKCATQNTNESLHHVIWGVAPKEQYNSPQECSLAVNLGVLLFNSGMEVIFSQLLPMIGLQVTDVMTTTWKNIDDRRIYGAEYKGRSDIKQRRKRFKRQKAKKADAFVHKEGVQYQSQGFYNDKGDDVGKVAGTGKGAGTGTGAAKGKSAGKGKGTGKGKSARKGAGT